MTLSDTADYKAFVAGIVADPGNDLRRLVFADFMEENGEAERAELIRLQLDPLYRVPCGQARRPIPDRPDVQVDCLFFASETDNCRPEWCPQCKVRWRVRAILASYDADTVKHVDYPFIGNGWTDYTVLQYSRGFISHVRCPLSWWMGVKCVTCNGTGREYAYLGHGDFEEQVCQTCFGTGGNIANGPRMVREHPVEVVTITDRESWEWRDNPHTFGWYHEQMRHAYIPPVSLRRTLPAALFDLLDPCYRVADQYVCTTREAADSAASAVLILWAKGVNG